MPEQQRFPDLDVKLSASLLYAGWQQNQLQEAGCPASPHFGAGEELYRHSPLLGPDL